MIRIHNFPHGARGVRVGWVCEEMGLPYAFSPVNYPPSPEYLAQHPLGTVPFLEDGDVKLHESVAIMLYLAQRYGPTPLAPESDPERAQVLQWTVFGEASLGACLNPLLTVRYGGAPEAEQAGWTVKALQNGFRRYLAPLEARLADRDFLVGDGLTLADISVVTALQVWRGGLNGALPEVLTRYVDRCAASGAYQKASEAQRAA
jgi:glutathione S-transferase